MIEVSFCTEQQLVETVTLFREHPVYALIIVQGLDCRINGRAKFGFKYFLTADACEKFGIRAFYPRHLLLTVHFFSLC